MKAPKPALPLLRGTDLAGTLHHIGEKSHTRGVVVVFLATHCPISNGCLPDLNQFLLTHRKLGIEVYGVISSPGVSRLDAVQHQVNYRVRFPVLFDASSTLRKQLKPTHTPHAFLLSRDGDILYQGAIDNRFSSVGRKKDQATEHYLQDAVTNLLSDKDIAVPWTKPIGCHLEDQVSAKDGAVTFNRDIAPILFTQCSKCHRPGSAAPFSLLTYEDASQHAKQIAEVTASRLMPPWKAAPNFGHFRSEQRLNAEEIDLFQLWVKGGKPKGRDVDLPPQPKFSDGWRLGEPDLVLKMSEPFHLPAAGPDIHHHFVLPTGIKDTRLISAVEFKAGNPRVTHHACFYMDTQREARQLDQQDILYGYGGGPGAGFLPTGTLRSWLPGQTPRRLPGNSGRLIMKNSDLILELHYQCSGKPETDQSTVGIYFASRQARQLVEELQILNYHLEIPAGESRHRHLATYTVPADIVLLDCAPHMHLLGREMKATATQPDGKVIPLIWIPDWDFNWQEQYEYLDPVHLPAGTRIDVEAIYDNSTGNPQNPFSPPRVVRWGEQTKDEMAICHFQYTCDRLEDFIKITNHYAEYQDRMVKEIRVARQRDFDRLQIRKRSDPPPSAVRARPK